MTPRQKSEARAFVPETLLYGVLVTAFCFGVIRRLGHPLQTSFHEHRVEYAFLALGLMIFQGFVLERVTHAVCSLLRRRGKGPP